MSSFREEVYVVHINKESVRTELPFIEYHIMNNDVKPIAVEDPKSPTMVQFNTYRAKVHEFAKASYLPNHYTHRHSPHVEYTRIALTEEAQQMVDMFVDAKTKELYETISALRTVGKNLDDLLHKERTMTLWDRFKRLVNGRKFTWTWDT